MVSFPLSCYLFFHSQYSIIIDKIKGGEKSRLWPRRAALRAVTGLQQRLSEASRTGFKTCIIPRHGTANLTAPDGVELLCVRNIREAIELALA